MTTEPQKRLLNKVEVAQYVGFGKTKINELVKAGKFPQPIRFSQNNIRWDLTDINAWIELQKAEQAQA